MLKVHSILWCLPVASFCTKGKNSIFEVISNFILTQLSKCILVQQFDFGHLKVNVG